MKLIYKLQTLTLIMLFAFGAGVYARPSIESQFKPQLAKDVSGYETVMANIDSGEVYNGR